MANLEWDSESLSWSEEPDSARAAIALPNLSALSMVFLNSLKMGASLRLFPESTFVQRGGDDSSRRDEEWSDWSLCLNLLSVTTISCL